MIAGAELPSSGVIAASRRKPAQRQLFVDALSQISAYPAFARRADGQKAKDQRPPVGFFRQAVEGAGPSLSRDFEGR
jgi:hypothetical protein